MLKHHHLSCQISDSSQGPSTPLFFTIDPPRVVLFEHFAEETKECKTGSGSVACFPPLPTAHTMQDSIAFSEATVEEERG